MPKLVLLSQEDVDRILSAIGLTEPLFIGDLPEVLASIVGDVDEPRLTWIGERFGYSLAERLYMYGDSGRGLIVQDYGNNWFLLLGFYVDDPNPILARYGVSRYEVFDSVEYFIEHVGSWLRGGSDFS